MKNRRVEAMDGWRLWDDLPAQVWLSAAPAAAAAPTSCCPLPLMAGWMPRVRA